VSQIFEQFRWQFGSLDIFVSNARPEAPTFYEAPMGIALEKWDAHLPLEFQGVPEPVARIV
jgi:NAD(P)-dependent dehydrogenase (short-subunit alcohol dehydrogenase family)